MRITVLGSAAGGGFPQWNCNCRNCAGVRSGSVRAKPRTQSSIFVRADDETDGVLFNASPDILQQIRATPALQPGRALRDTAIGGVVLIDGQVDHATGPVHAARARQPAAAVVHRRGGRRPDAGQPGAARAGALLRRGAPAHRARRHALQRARRAPGIDLRAFALASKAAPYSPHRDAPAPGDNIGVLIIDRAQRTQRVLRAGPGRDHAGAVRHDVRRRRGAGRRHVLDR